MKKIIILVGLLLLTTGCGEKINTCNIKTSKFEQNWKYTSKKDEIKKIELNIVYDNSIFENIDSFSSLNDREKEVLKEEILSKLGFEKSKYDGFDIDIVITDKISTKALIDISKADKELIKKIGIDFGETGTNINDVIKNMKDNGATCK